MQVFWSKHWLSLLFHTVKVFDRTLIVKWLGLKAKEITRRKKREVNSFLGDSLFHFSVLAFSIWCHFLHRGTQVIFNHLVTDDGQTHLLFVSLSSGRADCNLLPRAFNSQKQQLYMQELPATRGPKITPDDLALVSTSTGRQHFTLMQSSPNEIYSNIRKARVPPFSQHN